MRTVNTRELAEILGISVARVRANARSWPHMQFGGSWGRYLFDLDAVLDHLGNGAYAKYRKSKKTLEEEDGALREENQQLKKTNEALREKVKRLENKLESIKNHFWDVVQ